MSITIELRQTQEVIPGVPMYRVTNKVTRSIGIEREIFVMNTETDYFEHVATVWHIDNTPASKEEATVIGSPYYLSDEAYREYPSIETALEFAVYTRSRTEGLARAYSEATGEFPGVFDYTYIEG